MINEIEVLETLVTDICRADWGYERSDDYSAYSRGRGQCESITEKMKEMSFDQDDISYLKLFVVEMRINDSWSEDMISEFIKYWSNKVDYLTRK